MPNKLKLNKKNTYYFIGIGGSGMSAQAKILISSGYKVAGSELVHSPNTDELETLGVHINYEITQNNIQDNQVIIYSNAVSIDQIELQKAKELDLAIYNRAEFISLLETAKGFSIAISGAHGKTSTTSLVAFLLEEAGLDPTCLIGGILPKWGSNARVGKSEYFVYEACEAFGNLANYNPTHIIVTNIDKDHLEYFDNDYNKFKEYWIEYINRIASNESNFVLLNYDDLEIKSVISRLSLNVHFFSLEKTNHDEERIIAHATNIQTTENGTGFFLEFFLLKKAISVSLPLFGKHNVANATAALTMCSQFVEPEKLIPTLQRFQNSKRRFELAGIFNGAKIYNDYGHLPVEVACAISAGEQSIATIDE